MRYYLIAGERSGDLHAGNLAKALRDLDPQADMRGFGGESMRKAGVTLAFNYSEVAVMGFLEVVLSLRKISRYLANCQADIAGFAPDVLILVDYGGFNKRMAAWAKRRGIRVFYYISPKVWAWNQRRAWKLKASVDRMFVILPFETEFFQRFDWKVDYVGNPVLDAVKAHTPSADFHARNGLSADRPIVALLPGSRRQELRSVIPVLAEVAPRFSGWQFVVAAIAEIDESLYAPVRGISNVSFILEDTYNLLAHADAAVVTSGTATLETALFKVPQVVIYSTSAVTYWIVRAMIRVPFISLPNLIAGREVVRELIQTGLTAANIGDELAQLIDGEKRNAVLSGYDEIYQKLDTGSASQNAARLMVGYLKAE